MSAEFIEAMQPYMAGPRGAISNKPGEACDNFHLFNAHYHHVLALLGLEDPDHRAKTFDFIQACEKRPGLYARAPYRMGDDTSQDELEAIASLAARFGWPFAGRIFEWGQKHRWYFDVAHPDMQVRNYYFARHPHFASFIFETGNPRGMSVHHYLLWIGALLDSARSPYGDTSGKLFMWNQVGIMEGRHSLTDLAIRRWKSKMAALYPKGPAELMAIYFGSDHPFARFGPATF